MELKAHLNGQNKYINLIKLLSNEMFLIACYDVIKGKPDNMTPGPQKQRTTIDGISLK